MHQHEAFQSDLPSDPSPASVNLAERALASAESAFATAANEQAFDLAFIAAQGLPGPAFVHAKKRKAWSLYGRAACTLHRLPAVKAACDGLASCSSERSQLAEVCDGYGIQISEVCPTH